MSDKDASALTPAALVSRDPVSDWGCNKYCPENDLACGNGTIRTPHPVELFGNDWLEWSTDRTNRSR